MSCLFKEKLDVTVEVMIICRLKSRSKTVDYHGDGKADWAFSLGDWPVGVDTAGSPMLQPSIIVLCKRNLYCFTQGGILRFNIRLQCIATHLFAYGKGETFLRYCIVASQMLLLYVQNVLIWTTNLQIDPVDLHLCSFGDYQCMLAILSAEKLSIGYLGTEPSLFCLPASQTRFVDYKERLSELQRIEATIRQRTTGNKSSVNVDSLQLECNYKAYQKKSEEKNGGERVSVVAEVILKNSSPLTDIRLLCYSQLNVEKCIIVNEKSKNYCTTFMININSPLVSSCRCQFFAVSKCTGRVASCSVYIPFLAVCHTGKAVQRNASYKLTLESTDSLQSFPNLLFDLSADASMSIGFSPLYAETSVSIFALLNPKRYRMYSESLPFLCLTTENLILAIREGEPTAELKCLQLLNLVLQKLFLFLELEQRKIKEQTGLEKACIQLQGAQASLLQKIKAPRPTSITHLGTFMEYTHEQIIAHVERVTMVENQLSAAEVSLKATLNLLVNCISLNRKKVLLDGQTISTGRQLTRERLTWILGKAKWNDYNKEFTKNELRSLFYEQCETLGTVMGDISEEEIEDVNGMDI